jgi:hypothetical protein
MLERRHGAQNIAQKTSIFDRHCVVKHSNVIDMRHLYRPPIVHLDRKGHKSLGFQVRFDVINHVGSPRILFWLLILCPTLRLSRNEIEPFFKHSHNPLAAEGGYQSSFWPGTAISHLQALSPCARARNF